jgi:hypothetical protein
MPKTNTEKQRDYRHRKAERKKALINELEQAVERGRPCEPLVLYMILEQVRKL